MNILIMESSTTSAKAMVYDSVTGGLQVAEMPFTGWKPEEGMQNPHEIYSQTVALARTLCNDKKIRFVVLIGTFHSLILCGQDMKPETPSFLWSFLGAKDICSEIRRNTDFVRNFYRKTGCMVHSIYPFFKLKYLRQQGCEVEDFNITDQGSYNYFKMTGVHAVMDCMASGSGLFNINDLDFDSDLLDELGITREQVPKLFKWNETRPLCPEAANILGVQAGIPVMSAGPDGAFNQLGSGALTEGVMTLSVGTSAALRMSVPNPRFAGDLSTWCYRSPKQWLSGAATSGGCNCVDWLKQMMFPAGASYADCEKGTGNIDKAPVFMPFLYGERCPGWDDERQALFIGLCPQNTPADLYYSVQEGVLFNIYQCFLKLCALNGRPQEIKISCGILRSPRWLQMCADILDHEISVDSTKNSSMAGGLLLALEILGIEQAFPTSKDDKKIIPQDKMHEQYMERFSIYEKQYESCGDHS